MLATGSQAWDQRAPLPPEQCKIHSPFGFADSAKKYTPICRQGYFVAYDAPAKIPAYVAYTLEPKNALGCIARTNAFAADQSVKGGPVPGDYSGTGYDRGHVSPIFFSAVASSREYNRRPRRRGGGGGRKGF